MTAASLRAAVLTALPFAAVMWLAAGGVAVAAEGYDAAPWWLLFVNQIVLVPAAVASVLWLGQALGGRAIALPAALLLAVLPVFGAVYALSRYRDTYVDQVLTQAMGIADGGRFPAGALSAVAGALALRSLAGEGTRRTAVLAGLAAGLAALAHPSGALVLVGIALAYAVAWRPLETGLLAVASVPGLSLAAGVHGVGLDVSWTAFSASMAGLREYFWSNRLLQWLPLAGAIGAARGSLPAAFLLAGWFGAFAVVYGASRQASVADGSFLVAFVPSLPAFCLLVACIPLLVPTLARTRAPSRAAPREAPPSGRG